MLNINVFSRPLTEWLHFSNPRVRQQQFHKITEIAIYTSILWRLFCLIAFRTTSGKTMLYVQAHSHRHANKSTWSASVIDFLMRNCVHFGTYLPDISRDIKLSSEQDNSESNQAESCLGWTLTSTSCFENATLFARNFFKTSYNYPWYQFIGSGFLWQPFPYRLSLLPFIVEIKTSPIIDSFL
jgi:hypothetical protein